MVVKLGDLIVDIKSEPLIGLTRDCERIRQSAESDKQVPSTAKHLETFGFLQRWLFMLPVQRVGERRLRSSGL